MPPPFQPVVQEGDRARIVRAHGEMFQSKGAIYALHSQLLKVAGIANSQGLRDAAREWLDHSDMIVSTSFDIDHFEAQIRDRAARGLLQFVTAMEATLADIRARNTDALANIDAAETALEDEYLALLPPQATQKARDRLRQVFGEIVRGSNRPDQIPKPSKKDPKIPDFDFKFRANADFGGPQFGRKMFLTVRKQGGPP